MKRNAAGFAVSVALWWIVPGASAQTGVNAVEVTASGLSTRVAVTTSPTRPVDRVFLLGYQNLYCARRLRLDSMSELGVGGGHLDFRFALYEKLKTMDGASMRAVLDSAAVTSGTREQQFVALFGTPLRPSSASFEGDGTESDQLAWYVTRQEQNQLNTGQEVTHVYRDEQGRPIHECVTIPQVDAAIAEAKKVYQAVIAAMQKTSGGKDAPVQGEPSGPRAR